MAASTSVPSRPRHRFGHHTECVLIFSDNFHLFKTFQNTFPETCGCTLAVISAQDVPFGPPEPMMAMCVRPRRQMESLCVCLRPSLSGHSIWVLFFFLRSHAQQVQMVWLAWEFFLNCSSINSFLKYLGGFGHSGALGKGLCINSSPQEKKSEVMSWSTQTLHPRGHCRQYDREGRAAQVRDRVP